MCPLLLSRRTDGRHHCRRRSVASAIHACLREATSDRVGAVDRSRKHRRADRARDWNGSARVDAFRRRGRPARSFLRRIRRGEEARASARRDGTRERSSPRNSRGRSRERVRLGSRQSRATTAGATCVSASAWAAFCCALPRRAKSARRPSGIVGTAAPAYPPRSPWWSEQRRRAIEHVETQAPIAPPVVSVPTCVISRELRRATARVVDLVGMRFLREHPRPTLSTVATSLVVTSGLIASASSAARSTSERMRVAFVRGALSDESDPVRRGRLSDRPVFASSLQLGCREHDMALQILRGISETPELCDVALLAAALDGAAGALAKYADVDLPTALRMYTSGFDLFQRHGIESLKHWSFDRIALARITALISKLRENSYRRDDPPSPPTADAVVTHAPLDMGAGATQS